MRIGCVLLAAGMGKRFGCNKLLADVAQRPMLDYILSNLPVKSFTKCVAVASNWHVLDCFRKYGIYGIYNNKPELGISRSIRLGIEMLPKVDACMFCVADQPLLQKQTIQEMIENYQGKKILSLASRDKRGNPVIFPVSLLGELAKLKSGQSGSTVITAHLELLDLYNIDDSTQLMDIDTKDNLKHITRILAQTNA